MTVLEAKAVRKEFLYPEKVEILRGVDLKVERGESVAIMGASGEGKSTLLHILGTLESASGGEVLVAGERIRGRNAPRLRNRHIGFVFQAFHLLDDATALENVLLPAEIGRHKRAEARDRAMDLLERVGLSDRANFSTKLLSGGEKQRVAIARALINDPEILLADEPTGNLDHANSAAIHELLFEVSGGKRALVVVTHDTSLAELCDTRYELCDGKLG